MHCFSVAVDLGPKLCAEVAISDASFSRLLACCKSSVEASVTVLLETGLFHRSVLVRFERNEAHS